MNPIFITKHHCDFRIPGCKQVLLAVGVILLSVGLSSSCGTTRGFGRDVEKTGEKIQDAAAR